MKKTFWGFRVPFLTSNLPLLLSFYFFAANIVAQTFTALPDTFLAKTVEPDLANEVYIFFDNPSGQNLTLKWRRKEVLNPQNWDIDICDYGTCYTNVPAAGTMNVIHDTVQAYLKLIVHPENREGTADLWFRVLENGNETNFVDVHFQLSTPNASPTHTIITENLIKTFPNPASENLYLQNDHFEEKAVFLYDLQGNLIINTLIPPNTLLAIPVFEENEGLYFLKVGDFCKKILIQKS